MWVQGSRSESFGCQALRGQAYSGGDLGFERHVGFRSDRPVSETLESAHLGLKPAAEKDQIIWHALYCAKTASDSLMDFVKL